MAPIRSAGMPPAPRRRPLRVQATTRLAELRKQRGVSREELARAVGTSTTKLAKIESGRDENPPLRILNNCALALGASLEDVVEPDWRLWWNRYGGQPQPPDPEDFWQPREPGS